jgi:diguanylate cyclase (GGDEF)-like protein
MSCPDWLCAAAFVPGFVVGFAVAGALIAIAQTAWRRRQQRHASRPSPPCDQERYRDTLTGLPNRAFFLARGDALWRAAQRAQDEQHSAVVFVLEIDFFQRIPDRYGAAAGEAVVIDVAQRLRQSLREDDLIVRWGDAQFLLYSARSRYDSLPPLATRIVNALAKTPLPYRGDTIQLTASIGYALVPMALPTPPPLHLDDAIRLADAALYLAQTHGRNCAIGVRRVLALNAGKDALFTDLHASWYRGDVELLVTAGWRIPLAAEW